MSTSSLFCTECGQGLPAASRFCDQCGTPVVVTVATQQQTTSINTNIINTNAAAAETDFDLLGLNADDTTTTTESSHSAPAPATPPIAASTTTTTTNTNASTDDDNSSAYEDLFKFAGGGGGDGSADESQTMEQLFVSAERNSSAAPTTANLHYDSNYDDDDADAEWDGPVFSVTFVNGVPATLEVGPDAYNRTTLVTSLPEAEEGEEEEEAITGVDKRKLRVGDQVLEINGELVSGDGVEKIRERLAALSTGGGEGQQQSCKLKLRRKQRSGDNTNGDACADSTSGGVDGGAYSSVFDMPWANGSSSAEHESMLMIHNTKSALYEPPSHMDMVYCYIERFRGDKMITFHFKRESDDQFILAASMEAGGKGKIVFHSTQEITHRGTVSQLPSHSDSAAFYGTCCQNLLGTEFVIRDYHVSNPTAKESRGRVHELGLIRYESNIMGRVPNSITAILPRYDAETSLRGQRETLHDRLAKLAKKRRNVDKSIIEVIRTGNEKEYSAVELEEMEDLLMFDTKKPSWNEKLGAWTLNFNGRVKVASKKNFLLVPDSTNEAMDDEFGGETVCLRFGKVTKHRFSLDYRHPMSPIQAFGICLTTFATKLAVT